MLTRRFTGLLLIVLGTWGGIIPYLGPSFGYRLDSTAAWTWTTAHAELSLGPGVAVVVAGLLVLAGSRVSALLALLGGTWFVLGPLFGSLWLGAGQTRVDSGSLSQVWAPLGYHYGTGLVIVALAAFVLGRRLIAAVPVGASTRPVTATAGPAPAATWSESTV
jgi:hypothetical protein